MTAVIEVTGLTKHYAGQAVVDDISFHVVAPAARSAAGLGWLLFFPNMFLAGVYIPTEEMSPVMRQIGTFTPLGSALHAVRDSWMGLAPRPGYLGIMAAYAVIAAAVAARFFRWEQA